MACRGLFERLLRRLTGICGSEQKLVCIGSMAFALFFGSRCSVNGWRVPPSGPFALRATAAFGSGLAPAELVDSATAA
jgi:hypothetical protein